MEHIVMVQSTISEFYGAYSSGYATPVCSIAATNFWTRQM